MMHTLKLPSATCNQHTYSEDGHFKTIASKTLISHGDTHTTMLISLPGTYTNLRTCLPSTHLDTFSSANAASRASASLALAAMFTRPRSLPLTCTTISSVSCVNACGSTFGHDKLMIAS